VAPKREDKELDSIIRKQMPGYHLRARKARPKGAEGADDDLSAAAAEATTPSLEDLRAKYLGKGQAAKRGAKRSAAPRKTAKATDDTTEIAIVEKDGAPADAFERAPAKAVIVDRKSKKIVGAQG
jgi:hypothetical protein